MKKLLGLLATLLFGISGCGDSYTFYSLCVDNRTEDTIEITFLEGSPYFSVRPVKPEKLIFPPGTKKVFYNVPGRTGKNVCGDNYTGIKEGEIKVSTSSGRKLLKKIWVVNNWECTGNNSVGWEQTFVITENDLE